MTVYCTHSAAEVTPDHLRVVIEAADLRTLGDREGASSHAIEAAIDSLDVENTDFEGFNRYRICYHPSAPPIDVVRSAANGPWSFAALVSDLADARHPSAGRIQAYLETTTDIVELAVDPALNTDMAPVIMSVVAQWLAGTFGGIIHAGGEAWWRVDESGNCVVLESDVIADGAGGAMAMASPARVLRYASKGAENPARLSATETAAAERAAAEPPRTFRNPVPTQCPTCGAALRRPAGERNELSFTSAGRALLIAAISTTFILYVSSLLFIRHYVFIPTRLLAMVLFPIALIPGLLIAFRADRLPKELKIRCPQCGWYAWIPWK